MSLTTEQQATLKAAILADPTFSTLPPGAISAHTIANALRETAVPDFVVWKSRVAINEVGKGFVNTGLAALISANNDRLISFAAYNNEVEPARADQRAFFDDVFSAASGASTRASLLALWKRLANRGEKILETGPGSDASPATLTFEGSLSPDDVQQARDS